MTKTAIKNLASRIERIEPQPTAEIESQARQAWICVHLTEEEQAEAARILKEGSEQPFSRFEVLLRRAEERAAKEPATLREIFVKNQARAETLRNMHRQFTEAEGDELRVLNDWFFYRNHWSEKRQCLVALTEHDSQASSTRDRGSGSD